MSVTAQDPEGRKFMSIVSRQYDKACLSDKEAQRVNDTPGLADFVSKFIAKNRLTTDRFKNEEVKRNQTYPREYKGPKSVEAQVELLLTYFPGLDPEPTFRYMRDVYSTLVFPDWIEGPFLAPHEYILAEKFGLVANGRREQYCASVRLAFEKIATSRKFYNYRNGQIVPEQFRRIAKTAEVIDRLIELQGNAQILVHPTQFGIRHAGRSVRRARAVFSEQEFGEGSLEVVSFTLTHPERFVRWQQLHVDIAGDEFSEDDGAFGRAPYFHFHVDRVGFGAFGVDNADERYGSASGFLPQ